MSEPETVYVTKYAATRGILRVQALVDGLGLFATWKQRHDLAPGEWFTSLDEARIDARQRIRKAWDAAKRKVSRLSALLVAVDVDEPKEA